MERDSGNQKQMSFDEYLDFLEEFWELFGVPPKKEKPEYGNIKI